MTREARVRAVTAAHTHWVMFLPGYADDGAARWSLRCDCGAFTIYADRAAYDELLARHREHVRAELAAAGVTGW